MLDLDTMKRRQNRATIDKYVKAVQEGAHALALRIFDANPDLQDAMLDTASVYIAEREADLDASRGME